MTKSLENDGESGRNGAPKCNNGPESPDLARVEVSKLYLSVDPAGHFFDIRVHLDLEILQPLSDLTTTDCQSKPRDLLTTEQVAKELGCKPKTVRKLIAKGILATLEASRPYKIPLKSLMDFKAGSTSRKRDQKPIGGKVPVEASVGGTSVESRQGLSRSNRVAPTGSTRQLIQSCLDDMDDMD